MVNIRHKYYDKWRRKAKKPLRVLFIAESPPRNNNKYFYFDNKPCSNRELLYRLLEVLLPKELNELKENFKRNEGLIPFIKKGFFMIDSIDNPKFKKKKLIRKLTSQDKERIYREIESLKPKHILILGHGVYKLVSSLLNDYPLVKKPIYFPSMGHENRFKQDFRDKQIRRICLIE